MITREDKLETLLSACVRLLAKESHYSAQVPKVLESDFRLIENIVDSITGPKLETKVKQEQGDLS